MTPLEIKILLHYHAYADDYKGNGSTSEKEAVARFSHTGYLIKNDMSEQSTEARKYKGTGKLHVYCDALCKVPEPEQRWVVGGVLVAGQGE